MCLTVLFLDHLTVLILDHLTVLILDHLTVLFLDHLTVLILDHLTVLILDHLSKSRTVCMCWTSDHTFTVNRLSIFLDNEESGTCYR